MSSKTKIIVLRMKEIIYTAIFVGLALLLIALFFIMFRRDKADSPPESSTAEAAYIPGVYSCAITLASEQINVEVSVDAHQITSIALRLLSDSVAAMYPLMEPAMQALSAQILKSRSLASVTSPTQQKYTSAVLLRAIQTALDKAVPQKTVQN